MLGSKIVSDGKLSQGAGNPGLFLIFARWSAMHIGDSSLLAIRQLGLTMRCAMLRYNND